MRRTALGLTALSLLVAACGGAEDGAGTTTTLAATTSTPPTNSTSQPTPTTTTLAPTTTAAPATTTTTQGAVSTTLAGQPIVFGPTEGEMLMVIGVRFDDVLNLRAGPGADQRIVGGIPPTFADLVALGNTRELPSSLWIEVEYEDDAGWVHMGYIGYEGATTDDTARVIEELGETPIEPTMAALGELVAELYSSEDLVSDIVQVTETTSGDLSEVTYDVVGLADDSVLGVRVHVFAEEVSGRFTLRTVEVTPLCGRGVDDQGLCV